MDFQKTFLPFRVTPAQDDAVIASPVYVFEALLLEKRKLSAAKFFRRLLIVDAVNGNSQITKYQKLKLSAEPPHGTELYILPAKITPSVAEFIAKKCTHAYEARDFGYLRKNWRVYLHDAPKAVYHAYLLRGERLIDSFSGCETAVKKGLLERLKK